MYGLKQDWVVADPDRCMLLEDYKSNEPRWCPGCGDHAVLSALQRICVTEQLPPEKVCVVSGIGCSSRLPHYMKTFGFHSLHGRPLPVACGVRSRRPDLHLFVVTGDGDNCAIGTSHWIHAIRYNMNMTIMLLDNNIYGLTKKQSSPTTRIGEHSNTHPTGVYMDPIDPISVTLGVTGASFVAQTCDWNLSHLAETLHEAWRHKGCSFVRVIQRCPHFTGHVFEPFVKDPSRIQLMLHPDGIEADDKVLSKFKNQVAHDPADIHNARELAHQTDVIPIGLFYRNVTAKRYDDWSTQGIGTSPGDKIAAVNKVLDSLSV
jgi:2-oxoglutarate ferredoxin oxidoreductase subunit beta